jgi:hypothetical protein
VREVAEECNLLIGSCHDIITTKLEMHRVVSKFAAQLQTQDQVDSHVDICQELLRRASEDENFLAKHGFMDAMWKRKCSLHMGLKNETVKGAAGQVERESHVDFFYIECVVHEFLHQDRR